MPIANRDYYGATQRGREDALTLARARTQNALGRTDLELAQKFNALASNPAATSDQYARIGRSDVANALTNATATQQKQGQLDAQRLFQAAQWGLKSQSPKAFIAQNYPEIAAMNPQFAQETDEQIRAGLQDLLGRFGPQAGIGPEAPRGAGAMYKYVNDNGQAVYGSAEDVSGRPVYDPPSERAPPSGYRWANGRLEPIPGGPADPTTPSTRDDSRIFAKADKLRDEFNAQSKDFIVVNDSYNQVRSVASNPSAAGDLSMIFSFMKMLDPNSVVREQEFANAQNAAGVPDRVRNAYNRLLSGERLNPSQRADFISQAKNLYGSKKARQDSIVKRYTEIAKRNNVNPDDVTGDLSVALEMPATGTPAVGAIEDGYRFKGGNPADPASWEPVNK